MPCGFLVSRLFGSVQNEVSDCILKQMDDKTTKIKYDKYNINLVETTRIMLNNENLANDAVLDGILKESAEGYGDLMAAALVYGVSMDVLQTRVRVLQRWRIEWIS
jgi:hypothetical protein